MVAEVAQHVEFLRRAVKLEEVPVVRYQVVADLGPGDKDLRLVTLDARLGESSCINEHLVKRLSVL